MATGSAFAGCPTGVCEETLFGCCDDGETPASALPKAKRRRRRQAEESEDGERWKDEQPLLNNIFKVRLTPLVSEMMPQMMTVKLREKAKGTVMALEMLQRKKKERMRRSVKRTRSARTGNLVIILINYLFYKW